jgi:hypothetical membrane protein
MQILIESIRNLTLFQYFNICGTLSAVLGSLIAAIPYRGREDEHYSLLNHLISKLGERSVSWLARVFNLGLILCVICLLPACIILGMLLPGTLLKM